MPTGADMLARMWPVYEAELERHLAANLSDEEAETIRAALVRARSRAPARSMSEPQVGVSA